ncbi:MAG: hypothetical protein LBJ64_08695 [Deltaproteobacteria bacterium]|jgi:hypothetical protein|nr:hypothetical protein [Deltaproteobacteria bacterium]
MKTRHLIKLAILVPGLAFLFWWGWSGNFSFNAGSLFRLTPSETFYHLAIGKTRTGLARREIVEDADNGQLSVVEESVVHIPPGSANFSLRAVSETAFDSSGRLLTADFTIPFGGLTALAKARRERERLIVDLSFAGETRQAEVALPPAGPILISGLVPWLSYQRDLPLGRPLGLELLDPISLSFKPAELTIEDVTEEADELQVFKLTLNFMGSETVEWIDSQGKRLRQYYPLMELGQTFILDPGEAEAARAALKEAAETRSQQPLGRGVGAIAGFLAKTGFELLADALGDAPGLADSPWLKVPAQPADPPGGGD